jgi:FecR-like protein
MSHRFSIALALSGCLMLAAATDTLAMPSPIEDARSPVGSATRAGLMQLAQTQPAQAPAPAAAADPQTSADEPIGNVATLTGSATVVRNKNSLPLKLKDDIYLNDELQTSANSTLGITFNDSTTFNLTANAKITVDNYIYEDGGKQNAALFDITRGTVAFVAAAVAKTGDMKISTPTATLGIRGTTGLVEVPEGAAARTASNVKLYPDADGRVGRIEVSDRSGARLGFLTQGASGFTIRGGPGMRATALPLQISAQQAQRDQGIVRQVHAAQSVGRQVVTQQRALRRANPPRQGGPQRPSGPQRQNNLQNRPGLPQQPGAPGRQGLQQRPGSPAQSGSAAPTGVPQRAGESRQPGVQPLNRPGLQSPPGAPQPGIRQGAAGAPQPGLQNRPGLLKPRPALPARKGKKEKRY